MRTCSLCWCRLSECSLWSIDVAAGVWRRSGISSGLASKLTVFVILFVLESLILCRWGRRD